VTEDEKKEIAKSIKDAQKTADRLKKRLEVLKKEWKAQPPKAQAVRPIIRKGSQRGR
jgi:hypothetical protein